MMHEQFGIMRLLIIGHPRRSLKMEVLEREFLEQESDLSHTVRGLLGYQRLVNRCGVDQIQKICKYISSLLFEEKYPLNIVHIS